MNQKPGTFSSRANNESVLGISAIIFSLGAYSCALCGCFGIIGYLTSASQRAHPYNQRGREIISSLKTEIHSTTFKWDSYSLLFTSTLLSSQTLPNTSTLITISSTLIESTNIPSSTYSLIPIPSSTPTTSSTDTPIPVLHPSFTITDIPSATPTATLIQTETPILIYTSSATLTFTSSYTPDLTSTASEMINIGCTCQRLPENDPQEKDCDSSSFDFVSQAQACFDYCMRLTDDDIYGLDEDNDNAVCEHGLQ